MQAANRESTYAGAFFPGGIDEITFPDEGDGGGVMALMVKVACTAVLLLNLGITVPARAVDGLQAAGPREDLRESLALYAPLIGEWDVVSISHPSRGTLIRRVGEWNFGWVLEGRAIQDVFIIPARGHRAASDSSRPQSYGTTLRMPGAAAGVWQVVYMDPAYRFHMSLSARRVGNEIVQEGIDPDGHTTRWVFSDITPATFHWRAETTRDGGASWQLEQEILATRKVARTSQ